jgi:type VI secretion system secreted protein VgrG
MAEIEQWVNLTRNNKWKGDGLDSRDRMSPTARLRIQFDQEARATAWVSKTSDADNAVYSPTERPRRQGFRVREYNRRRVSTNRKGRVTLTIPVTLAGGDSYTIALQDRQGNQIHADDIVTRRKLYFQIVRMQTATALTAASLQSMKDEYWRPRDKLYLKMVEVSPGRTITDRRNYNDIVPSVVNRTKAQLRRVFDRRKRPYVFVTMLVKRNGVHRWEERFVNNFMPGAVVNIPLTADIFSAVDPRTRWFGFVRWSPNSGGSFNIPIGNCTRIGTTTVRVNLAGHPAGPGRLHWRFKVVCVNGRGLSLPTENLTLLATEDAVTGNPVPQNEMLAVLNHEMGHKIGMVPGGPINAAQDAGRPAGDRGYLDRQATYYWARGHSGGHCHQGVALLANFSTAGGINPTCTMFGDTRATMANFCADCRANIRKLDLRSRTNPGIRNQF